jgi:hypothetical protein
MSTDCLVLKIEEYDSDNGKLDTTMYIIYDKQEHKYVVRGQRDNKKYDSCTYSFNCEFAHELIDFLTFVICRENMWTFVLYNYDNLPATSDEITYEFMVKHDSKNYELAGYDKQKFNKKNLAKNLRMLRNVFNYYN